MTIKAAKLLGKTMTDVLPTAPFCDWRFERSADEDLDEPLVYFEFKAHGIDFTCRDADKISTIFFSAEGEAGEVFELPMSLTRNEIRNQFGEPDASGEGLVDAVLGAFGSYDRYDYPDYSMHFEYFPDRDRIKLVTLMSSSVVPGR